MKRLFICIFALSLLPLVSGVAAAAGYGSVGALQGKVKKAKDPKPEKSVPEPSVVLLLAGAAGVAGARKFWLGRR